MGKIQIACDKKVNDNKSSEALLYLGASARAIWLLVLLPASIRAGFGRTGADGGGGGGGKGGVGRWFLAVWQRVVNALHSARGSRGTLVAS